MVRTRVVHARGPMGHTMVLEYHWYTCTYALEDVRTMVLIMLCHNFLIGKGQAHMLASMCTENHVCFGRIHGSQLREGANAGQHTPTLSLPYVRTMLLEYCTNGTYQMVLREVPMATSWYTCSTMVWRTIWYDTMVATTDSCHV